MGAVSKMYQPIHATCYDLVHPLNSSCGKSFIEAYRRSFIASFKLYIFFYMSSSIFKGNKLKYFRSRLLQDVLQSTNMVASNVTLFQTVYCVFRLFTPHDRYYYQMTISAFIGSLLAIIQERPARRAPLALYLSHLALGSIHKDLSLQGYPVTPPCADILILAAALMLAQRLAQTTEEFIPRFVTNHLGGGGVATLALLQPGLQLCSSSHCDDSSLAECGKYTLRGVVTNMSCGAAIDLGFWILKTISSGRLSLPQLKFAKFLSLLTLLFRSTRCLVTRAAYQIPQFSDRVCCCLDYLPAAVSSLALFVSRDITGPSWLLLKLSQIWLGGTQLGRLSLPGIDMGALVYSLANCLLLHNGCYRPHLAPPSYVDFQRRMTGNLMSYFPREYVTHHGWLDTPIASSVFKCSRVIPDPKFSDLWLPSYRSQRGWDIAVPPAYSLARKL